MDITNTSTPLASVDVFSLNGFSVNGAGIAEMLPGQPRSDTDPGNAEAGEFNE